MIDHTGEYVSGGRALWGNQYESERALEGEGRKRYKSSKWDIRHSTTRMEREGAPAKDGAWLCESAYEQKVERIAGKKLFKR